jgi:hypothetical protein
MATHVGDGLIGKYGLVLTEAQIADVGRRTGEFRALFDMGEAPQYLAIDLTIEWRHTYPYG